ncbi:MAG: fimbrillin family protein, partial [Proteiniphilum sp.]|nr:fimbrillin family protein [Proteiniphilum sp.]
MKTKYISGIFKKWLPVVGALLLTAGMAGCVVEPDMESALDNNGKPILFSPKVNKNAAQSRAASGHPIESGYNIPSGGSFGVYAYSKIATGSSIEPYAPLQNTKVTASGSGFVYDPIAKWPVQSSAKLAFFGYYPRSEQNQNPAAGDPVIDVTTGGTNSPSMTIAYTTPSDQAKHIDLMWA